MTGLSNSEEEGASLFKSANGENNSKTQTPPKKDQGLQHTRSETAPYFPKPLQWRVENEQPQRALGKEVKWVVSRKEKIKQPLST